MTKTPLQFLMDVCGCGDDCNIDYKPYEYGSLVESIHMDIDLDEIAVKAAYSIWKKHLIVY